MEKTLKHCANCTRPSNSDCPPTILTKYGLEKCFRRAILYPLYCDQDFATSMDASVFMLPSYSSQVFMSPDDYSFPSGSSTSISSASASSAITSFKHSSGTQKAVLSSDQVTRCFHCGKQTESMKRCGACLITTYCSRECQKSDWKRHKKDCTKK